MLARISCSLTDGPGQRTLANRVEGDIAPARATELIAWLFTWHHQSDMHGSAFVHASRGELVVCRFFPDPLVDGRSEQCAADALVFDEASLLNSFTAPTDALAFLEQEPLATSLPQSMKHSASARARASELAARVDAASLATLLVALSKPDAPDLKRFDKDALELCMLLVPRNVRPALTFSVQTSAGTPTPKPAVVFRQNGEAPKEAPVAWARAAADALIVYADRDDLPIPATTTETPFEALIQAAAQTMAFSDHDVSAVIQEMLALPSLTADAAKRFVSTRAQKSDTMDAIRTLALLSTASPATNASQVAANALTDVLTEITRAAPRAVIDDFVNTMRQPSPAADGWTDLVLEQVERLSPTTAALIALRLPGKDAKSKKQAAKGHASFLRGESANLAPDTVRWLLRDALGADASQQANAPIHSAIARALAAKLAQADDGPRFVGELIGETLTADTPAARKRLDAIAAAAATTNGESALERVVTLAGLIVAGAALSPEALGRSTPRGAAEVTALRALLDVLRAKASIGRVVLPVTQIYEALAPAQRERLFEPMMAALAASMDGGSTSLPPVIQALVGNADGLDAALLRLLVLDRLAAANAGGKSPSANDAKSQPRRHAAKKALAAIGRTEFDLDAASKREFEVAMALGAAMLGDSGDARVGKQGLRTSVLGRIWGWWRLHRWL